MSDTKKICLCLGRNQNAGDCRLQGKDLGVIAAGCQHREGAHSAHSGGVWHHSVPDGLQAHWRNQRYVAVDACYTNMDNVVKDDILKVYFSIKINKLFD